VSPRTRVKQLIFQKKKKKKQVLCYFFETKKFKEKHSLSYLPYKSVKIHFKAMGYNLIDFTFYE
jgi:hypothetical protein